MATYATTTRSTLRGRLRERLIPSFWSDSELNDLINEALRVWNCCTAINRDSFTGTLTYGLQPGGSVVPFAALSSLSSTALAILRVKTGSTILDQVSLEELGQFQTDWHVVSGSAPDAWTPLGLTHFGLTPSTTAGTAALVVEYIKKTTALTADGDYVQVAETDIPAILDFMEFASSIKEGGEELTTSVPLLQGFLKKAANYNAKLAKHSVFSKILGMPTGGQEETRPAELDSGTPR